ncbi:hypothetical protein BDZ91DRAFT_713858, partial [Kalaharituber pfeilii]
MIADYWAKFYIRPVLSTGFMTFIYPLFNRSIQHKLTTLSYGGGLKVYFHVAEQPHLKHHEARRLYISQL